MLDHETESKVEELVDELYEGLVEDRDLRYWEGGIVRTAPTGAPPEYISVEVEGIYDENVMWRGVPASLVVGDEVLVWENPYTHRREIAGGSGATTTSTSSPWQKLTVAVSGGDFALLSAAIVWINALPGAIGPAATRLFAINILGGNFAEAADVTVPQYVHVGGEGEGSEIEMGAFTLIMSSDTSLMDVVVESSDPVDAIRMNGASNVVLRNVRCVQGAAAACFHILGASSGIELHNCIANATTGNAVGFHIGGTATALLEYCQADDTTNFVDALLLDAASCTAATKWCVFHGTSGGDDVHTGAASTWNHFDCQIDPNNLNIAAGTHTALPTKRFNQEVIVAEEGGDFQELSEAVAWINAQGDAAANKLYGILMLAGNYTEAADVVIPQYVHVRGQGEGTVLDMGTRSLEIRSADISLESIVVTSTADSNNWVILVYQADNTVLREVRVIGTGGPGYELVIVEDSVGVEMYHVTLESTASGNSGFRVDYDSVILLWDCKVDDTTNFDYALYITASAHPSTVTTKFGEFRADSAGDDVFVDTNCVWEHFCTNFDPDNTTINGTETPLLHGKTNFDDVVTFEDGFTMDGISGANVVTFPDNVAQAVNLVDTGGLEYMRVVSTDAQPVIDFNNAQADIDIYLRSSGINGIFLQGSDGAITLGGPSMTVPDGWWVGNSAAEGARHIYDDTSDYLDSQVDGVRIARCELVAPVSARRFTVGDGTLAAQLLFDGAAGQVRDMTYLSGGSSRWALRCNATAEAGADAGSNFSVISRTDAGALSMRPIRVNRASGYVTIGNSNVSSEIPPRILSVEMYDAATTTISYAQRLSHFTSAGASLLFGVGQEMALEDAGGAMQVASEDVALWALATAGSEQPLRRWTNYPAGVAGPGYGGYVTANDVGGVALTIIPNGPGDVTTILSVLYAVSESAGGTSAGTITATTGGGAVVLYTDGVDTLSLTVLGGGAVQLQRTAGAATFDVSLWMVWV